MAIDYTKSPDEIITQLINDENGRSFSVTDLDLNSLAIAADPVPGRLSFNNVRTALRVTGAVASGYINEVHIKYNRVHLRQVFPTDDPDTVRYPYTTTGFVLGENVNLSDLIPQINAQLGINISPADIFDLPLPVYTGPPPYTNQFVRLEMQAGHKVFIGGINVLILPNAWDLGNMQYTELNGLAYPVDGGIGLEIPQVWLDIHAAVNGMGAPGYFGD